MQHTHDSAKNRLAELGMDDMPTTEVLPCLVKVAPDWFVRYKNLCKNFCSGLTDSVEELALMNFNQDEIISLLMGQSVPENLSIRFRIPLLWGGKLDTDNLFMCATFPQSQNLDRFILEQSGAKTVWLPNPKKKIYIPVHTIKGGDGGNATSDRLSQIAAQMNSGRENF